MPAPPPGVAAFLALARHVPLVLLSRAGAVVALTDAAARALGRPSSACAGVAWPEICADPRERTLEYIEQCARTLSPIPGAFHVERAGRCVRFRCEGFAADVPGEHARAIVLHVREQDEGDVFLLLGRKVEELNGEILRRRHSEQQLAEAEARLRAVLDQMPAGVMIAQSPSGKAVYANEQARSIFGGAIPAHGGSDYGSVFRAWHPDGRAYVAEDFPLIRALHGEAVTAQEVCFRRHDGSSAVVRVNAAPIRDERGAIVAAVATYFDVTDQKRLERATHAARAEAEAANRSKDEFLAMLGHELRNPLAPIVTALQLMQLRGVGADKERTIIERQIRHLSRLVDDLLDVSRITAGKIELKRERVELGAVVARAIELASPLLEKREIDLALSVPPAGLLLEADAARLAQVVSNLLANAAKYSERRGVVRVTGRLERGDVVLTVSDSGIGIAPDMLPRIFDWFAQDKQTLDRSQGGLGLGLAIVRSLVALHGGTVTAHSGGNGQGSDFTIRLPAGARRTAAIGAMAAPPELRPASPQVSALRVLVVDDNEDAVELLSEALALAGHTTRSAHDGPGALRVAQDFRPEIVLLDIGLPVMDGFEVATHLRADPALRDSVLIAVTGYGQQSDREATRAAGFDAHLVKPVDLAALGAIMQDLSRTAGLRLAR